MSSEKEAWVFARLMDYEDMMALRNGKRGNGETYHGVPPSPGGEHKAVIRILPQFSQGAVIKYDPKVLEDMLTKDIPELQEHTPV